MLLLTESATSAIRQLTDSPNLPEGAGLRIATSNEDENARRLTVSAASTPEPGDEVVEDGGVRVFLESSAVPTLEGHVLDAQVDENGRVKFQLAPQ